jgi:hypothetical protein
VRQRRGRPHPISFAPLLLDRFALLVRGSLSPRSLLLVRCSFSSFAPRLIVRSLSPRALPSPSPLAPLSFTPLVVLPAILISTLHAPYLLGFSLPLYAP